MWSWEIVLYIFSSNLNLFPPARLEDVQTENVKARAENGKLSRKVESIKQVMSPSPYCVLVRCSL